jgi:2-(1,2-epoxy-1,2-dihydrophenyl)acetyl-CoA isomerase
MEAADPVRVSLAEHVGWVTLNRPERLNAFDAGLHAALRAALDGLAAEPGLRAVVMTGAGRGFCAGQDLGERAAQFAAEDGAGRVDLRRSLEENYNPLVRRLAALPVPVIAAVNGIAAGAGAGLALACDVVLAGASARFQFPFAKVALGPDTGLSWSLPRLVGSARALGLMLTGEAIDAETARRWGLVWDVVPDAELLAAAGAMAARFAAGPRAALATVKRQMRVGAGLALDAALDAERDAQAALGEHPDYREAVTAFAAKRTPRFA